MTLINSQTDTDWGPEQSRAVTWHDPAKPAAVGLSMAGIDYLRAMVAGEIPPDRLVAGPQVWHGHPCQTRARLRDRLRSFAISAR